jgi:hypothetical protein
MVSFLGSTPPNELFVVGEHAEDPNQLLLKGSDGNFYAYELPEGDTHPVDVTDQWRVEEPAYEDVVLD